MLRITLLQIGTTLVAAVIVALCWGLGVRGSYAAVSAGLGGIACIVPNALFSLRMGLAGRHLGSARRVNFSSFFVWEFIKLALTVAILFLIALKFHQLNWLALLIGFIVALKSYLLSFLFDRSFR